MSLQEIRENTQFKKAARRLRQVPPSEVQDWAMQTLWATQQGLDGYRVTQDPAALEEAHRGALGLLAALEALTGR